MQDEWVEVQNTDPKIKLFARIITVNNEKFIQYQYRELTGKPYGSVQSVCFNHISFLNILLEELGAKEVLSK